MGLFKKTREDRAGLEKAKTVEPGDGAALKQDAKSGRPDFDLQGWADRRSLDFRGASSQAGYYRVTCPWSVDLLFNAVRGDLPGGSYGVLCHEVRLFDEDEGGSFHANTYVGGWRAELRGFHYFQVPYTNVGVRAPHLGRVTGVHVARRAERSTSTDQVLASWTARGLDDLGHSAWIGSYRKHSDVEVVERLFAGPIKEILDVQQGLGFELRIEYGQVVVSRQDFLRDDTDLDALAATACALADAVREICPADDGTHSLDEPLPGPAWEAPVRKQIDDTHTLWPIGARLERVVRVADERGMAIEDPRTFHRTFPTLNVPGEAFGVLRGTLPGTEIEGRMLLGAERPMWIPPEFRKVLTDPGGPAGCDVAVIAIDPATPPTVPQGDSEHDLRVAISDGVLTTWRPRKSWQADGSSLDQLAQDTAATMTGRGLA